MANDKGGMRRSSAPEPGFPGLFFIAPMHQLHQTTHGLALACPVGRMRGRI
ncbi:MAG: hypothetical protein ACUVUR_08165 [bacterium]